MLLSDQLLESGCSDLQFRPAKIRSLELYVYESGQTAVYDDYLGNDGLEDWTEQRGAFSRSNNSPRNRITGGLRLLCIVGADSLSFPLRPVELRSLVVRLGLPKSYPADSISVTKYGKQYVSDILSNPLLSGSSGINVTCISPRMANNAMDLVLSYNAATRITHGILMFSANRSSPLNDLIPLLKQLPELGGHPLLLPALACNAWYEIMAHQYGSVHDEIRNNVQVKTNMMPGYFLSGQSMLEDFDVIDQSALQTIHNRIHRTIVEQHNYLSNGLSYFVKAYSEALNACASQKLAALKLDAESDEELRSYIERLGSRIAVELDHRERLLAKLEVQMQVLYTLMQQRDSGINLQIADETKKDSSAMKTLSLITIIFLPLTAVAAVFSMGAFIASESQDGYHIRLSPQFWIYWAVVIPLTALILIAWIVWINRKQLLSRGKKRFSEWIDAWDEPQQAAT